jgi:N-acetylglucosaminyldiphosphoundecaprenol N-acetyl-beta-D-mannosaminyltransferase
MRTSVTNDDHRRQSLLNVPVDLVGRAEALAAIVGWLDAGCGLRAAGGTGCQGGDAPTLKHVVTVNPEFAIAARRDETFRRVLWESALATADGIGIVLAGRVLGVPVRERVTGVDLIESVAGLEHPCCRLFLLGAAPGVAEDAALRLRARFPEARIVGAYPGSPRDEEFQAIAARLAEAGATVLLVAFGHPRQDLWIARHRERLATHGILVAIGIGGAFDYLSGRVPRAPYLLRRLGLEWLYRLIRQPWRWRRQLALPLFVLLVARERLRRLPLLQRAQD